MINGGGTRETSSEVASPDPLDLFLPGQGQKSDDGGASPTSSQYSSCGESEFERYCSANSVLGTPSLCSSVGTCPDYLDSEFGSISSFMLDSGVANSNFGARFDRKYEDKKLSSLGEPGYYRRSKSCDGKSDAELRNNVESGQGLVGIKNELNFYDNMESSSSHEVNHAESHDMMSLKVWTGSDLPTFSDLNTAIDEGLSGEDDEGGVMERSSGNEFTSDKANSEAIVPNMLDCEFGSGLLFSSGVEVGSQTHMGIKPVDSCLEGLNSQSGLEFGGRDAGRSSDDGETSSRYEHSEGEESMFGYATDDEKKIDLYHRRNIQYPQKSNGKNENSLLMTSSIAFGSDDWDDFMQETGENTLASMVLDELQGPKQWSIESEGDILNSTSATTIGFPSFGVAEQHEDVRGIAVASSQAQIANELADFKTCSTDPRELLKLGEAEQEEDATDTLVTSNQVRSFNESVDYLEACSISNIFVTEQDPLTEEASLKEGLNIGDGGLERERQKTGTGEGSGIDDDHVSKSIEFEKTTLQFDPLSDNTVNQLCLTSREATEYSVFEFLEEHNPYSLPSVTEDNIKRNMKDSSVSCKYFDDDSTPIKTQNLELNEFYDEVVHEMEEILLDSGKSPGTRLAQGNSIYQSQLTLPLRDGGSTASTSGTDDGYPLIQHPLRIDGIEVVGARQKKGDVSLSERLVGVKEYTVYKIRVWSGEDHWEVERRYRDFCTLHRRLKTFFADQGWILPSPWSSVERESRKIFGNASPDVIAERSVLIQECLRSILHSRFSSSPSSALIWFLSPPKDVPSSPASGTRMLQSSFSTSGTDTENVSTLGKTISLVVEIWPYKTTKQMLEAQHYTCAGCHKHFDDGKTRMWEFVQTLGWGKPRLCEYSGQLFCSSCHTNETAVLPARVMHFWDFSQHPVSQLAKSYLDSIHDQPMLCVGAVNPFLFSKVPALQHVTNARKKIGAVLPYVRCPFRRSIYKGLGSRRYLLESSDFFALRDLIDLSKGLFAALPVTVETVLRKILEHITEQCLVCCDVGVPCNARQACDDPSSLIFPFQEGEIERCRNCESVFHKPCFKKIACCPCDGHLREAKGGTSERSLSIGSEVDGTLGLLGRKADSSAPASFLSGLFSKARPEMLWGPGDNDTVILMGSLPSTSF